MGAGGGGAAEAPRTEFYPTNPATEPDPDKWQTDIFILVAEDQKWQKFNPMTWPMIVEVFKTDVQEISQANHMIALLHQQFPGTKINFDLEDCDKVLRIEGHNILPWQLMQLITENGFRCGVLEKKYTLK